MEIIEGRDEIGWLVEGHEYSSWISGVGKDGYQARAKILHAMWEDPSQRGAATYDEVEEAAITEGRIQRRWIGTLTGVVSGPSSKPDGWRRLRWVELADRWDVTLDVVEVHPLSAFWARLSLGSWPSSIGPPSEGSLDWESYERLMSILRSFSGTSLILVYSTFLAWHGDTGFETPLVLATADELLAKYETSPIDGSGQNWWPIDRSWLVYSSYDLCSTVVHGDESLISEVVADEFLEASVLNPI